VKKSRGGVAGGDGLRNRERFRTWKLLRIQIVLAFILVGRGAKGRKKKGPDALLLVVWAKSGGTCWGITYHKYAQSSPRREGNNRGAVLLLVGGFQALVKEEA